ncbi:prohead core protein [Yersinia phage vB_YenM_TG1]|uniref:Prohead core protein n=1 Tax=Yersinia phage vB_YenM_TG1 TaxID=1589265 RepID=A0A0B5A4K5_9CAUD|nr:prohead [Yersinia phage vB_YenM_TG1]AJD81981.1 prohead core protein [Yersinia phage vB_YenM_TG1]
MEQLIEAIKSNDLVKAKKALGSIMLERTSTLVEAEKIAMAKSVMIEGEEPESEEKDDSEEDEEEE